MPECPCLHIPGSVFERQLTLFCLLLSVITKLCNHLSQSLLPCVLCLPLGEGAGELTNC